MMRNEAEQLFLKNMNLAHHVLHRSYPAFSQDEDLHQEALLGLWKACLTYDNSKSQFSTYAWCCILTQIRYALRNRAKQPETISLNHPVGEGLTFGDTLEDPCPCIDEGFIDLKAFLKGLTEIEHRLIQLNAEGFTQKEIQEQLGRSRTWCWRTLKRLQQDYLKQEDQDE